MDRHWIGPKILKYVVAAQRLIKSTAHGLPNPGLECNKSQLTAPRFATFHLYYAINEGGIMRQPGLDNLCLTQSSSHIIAIIAINKIKTKKGLQTKQNFSAIFNETFIV